MQTAVLRTVHVLALLWCLTACASAPQSAALIAHWRNAAQVSASAAETGSALAPSWLLDAVPFFPQEDYQCGPAALASVLQSSLVSIAPDALVSQVYVPARQGSLQIEMQAAPRRYGRLSYQLPPSLESILRELQSGRPVLVMQNLGLEFLPQWHYAVAVGYSLPEQELVLHSGTIRDYRVPLQVFERTWRRADHWALVMLRPGELPVDSDEDNYFQSVSAFESEEFAEEAMLAYRSGLQRWPESALLGMGYGNLAYAMNQFELAISAYSTVLNKNPEYAAAHNNLAQVLFEQGNRAAAEEHARAAIRLGGTFAGTYQSTLNLILSP